MIKILKIIPFVALLLLCGSCRKTLVGFDMTYRRQFDFPLGLSTFQSHNFEFKNIASDTSVFFNLSNTSSDKLSRIIPKAMNIRAIFPSAETRYNFIDRAEVWISNPNDANMTPQIIFFRDDIPLSTDVRLDLIPNDVDIKRFIVAGRFNVRLNFRLREIPSRSIETEWNINFLAQK